MKRVLSLVLTLSCLASCSQSQQIPGKYEAKNGSAIYLLELSPAGTFQFDSYMLVNARLPAETSASGRGTWHAEGKIIYFETNPDTDMDHNFTLNFSDTKARFVPGPMKDLSDDKSSARLEFFDAGIFWIQALELQKRE